MVNAILWVKCLLLVLKKVFDHLFSKKKKNKTKSCTSVVAYICFSNFRGLYFACRVFEPKEVRLLPLNHMSKVKGCLYKQAKPVLIAYCVNLPLQFEPFSLSSWMALACWKCLHHRFLRLKGHSIGTKELTLQPWCIMIGTNQVASGTKQLGKA